VRSKATSELVIRHADGGDIPALEALIQRSVHGLMAEHLTPEQRQVALGTTLGVDRQIIADGTYFVVHAADELVGAGGWSRRFTLYGVPTGEPRPLDPATEAARIRAFYVDPAWVRRGIATLILERSEADARTAGFKTIELMSTPTGFAFYSARGYETVAEDPIVLADGSHMGGWVMRKRLD
jgi:GNAT superfamily N-acetyltransferase